MKKLNPLTLSATALWIAAISATAQMRIEPSNWWIGMKEPVVQLMVHADGIADAEPSVNTKGVSISNIQRTDNKNYIFIDLKINAKAKAGIVPIKFSKEGKTVNTYDYVLRERQGGSSNRQGFDANDAIFLLMPDRFANGDPSNDDIDGMREKADRNAPYGRHGGDLKGVIDHIDYIQQLGMTALWMTPVLENDMEASSYHGYAITDYYNVDARFGTNADFIKLNDELHKRGMKSIMDMVFNHCGSKHWWMDDLPSSDWVNRWPEGFVRSNYRLSIARDTHASARDKDIMTRGWFDTTMPDMNLSNPLVRNYFIQNSIWWIETANLDGIRQDTYPYSDPEAMAEWNRRVRNEYPYFNIVGECWISEAAKLATWQKGFHGTDGFNSELPTVMDFPLQEAIVRAMHEPDGWSDGANRLYDVFANDFLYPDPMHILVFGENHDTGRLLTQLKDDKDALRMTTALLATARGIPQLYYGTETLMTGNGSDGHANIRRDFPGGWDGDDENYFKSMPNDVKAMHDYTARLFNFRKKSNAIRNGNMTHYLPEGNVYVYFRTSNANGERVMVILNLSHEQRTLTLSHYSELTNGELSGTDICSGDDINAKETLNVAPRKALVIAIGKK